MNHHHFAIYTHGCRKNFGMAHMPFVPKIGWTSLNSWLGGSHLRMNFLCWAFDHNLKPKMIKLAQLGSFYLFLIINK